MCLCYALLVFLAGIGQLMPTDSFVRRNAADQHSIAFLWFDIMGLLSILKKLKEKEVRLLML